MLARRYAAATQPHTPVSHVQSQSRIGSSNAATAVDFGVVEREPDLLDTLAEALFDATSADSRRSLEPSEATAMLAPLFTVVDEGNQGSAPNAVTAKEFSTVVDTYCALANDEFDGLRIARDEGWSAEATGLFESGLMADIALILQTRTGRQLIAGFADNPDGVTTTMDLNARDLRGEPARESLRPGGSNDPGARGNSAVSYVPGVETEYASEEASRANNPSHVVLFHELVHALGTNQGTRAVGRVGDDAVHARDRRLSREEYRATGLGPYAEETLHENAYRAERAEIGTASVGALPSDVDMPQREYYRARPAAGASTSEMVEDREYVEMLLALYPEADCRDLVSKANGMDLELDRLLEVAAEVQPERVVALEAAIEEHGARMRAIIEGRND